MTFSSTGPDLHGDGLVVDRLVPEPLSSRSGVPMALQPIAAGRGATARSRVRVRISRARSPCDRDPPAGRRVRDARGPAGYLPPAIFSSR
ncbi:MAG: hypothetical protein ACYTEZ_01110 [Planctomycetota bacterium]